MTVTCPACGYPWVLSGYARNGRPLWTPVATAESVIDETVGRHRCPDVDPPPPATP